jgi:hypothetical protein
MLRSEVIAAERTLHRKTNKRTDDVRQNSIDHSRGMDDVGKKLTSYNRK